MSAQPWDTNCLYKEDAKGKRRNKEHDRRECFCQYCCNYLERAGPAETKAEEIAKYAFEEREVKRAKRAAKKAVKNKLQTTITSFLKHK